MGYDDLYERRRRLKYGEETNFRRQETTRTTEDEIMEIITRHHENGIAHQELARIVRINRKNLGKYMGRLIARGWVVRGPGLQGKYYLATKEHRETSVSAKTLGEAIVAGILDDNDTNIIYLHIIKRLAVIAWWGSASTVHTTFSLCL